MARGISSANTLRNDDDLAVVSISESVTSISLADAPNITSTKELKLQAPSRISKGKGRATAEDYAAWEHEDRISGNIAAWEFEEHTLDDHAAFECERPADFWGPQGSSFSAETLSSVGGFTLARGLSSVGGSSSARALTSTEGTPSAGRSYAAEGTSSAGLVSSAVPPFSVRGLSAIWNPSFDRYSSGTGGQSPPIGLSSAGMVSTTGSTMSTGGPSSFRQKGPAARPVASDVGFQLAELSCSLPSCQNASGEMDQPILDARRTLRAAEEAQAVTDNLEDINGIVTISCIRRGQYRYAMSNGTFGPGVYKSRAAAVKGIHDRFGFEWRQALGYL